MTTTARIMTTHDTPGFSRRLFRKPAAVVSLSVVLLMTVCVFAAPWIAPYDPLQADLLHSLESPSGQHLLGTDALGRDILSRLLYGGQPTLLYALEASVVTFLVAMPLGLAAGMFGGRFDRWVMSINDIGMSVPMIVLILLVLSLFPTQFWIAMIALGIVGSPPIIRVLRGATLEVCSELFVDAAHVSGLSRTRIIYRHVLPRIEGVVLVQLTLNTALAVLFIASLGFLGFGAQPPNPTWGSMTAEAAAVLSLSPWLLIGAGGITGIFVLALGILGDTVRDAATEVWAGSAPALATQRRTRRVPASTSVVSQLREPHEDIVLTVRDLSVAIPRNGQELIVADQVDFEIAAGRTLGLVGESGCGKTSVARAILGLVRGGGTARGTILCDGQDVLRLAPRQLRHYRGTSVGYISQEPMVALDPCFRVGHQLTESVRHATGLGRADARRRVSELLTQVRLPHPERVARLYPHELSGGMAQRVVIAKALAGNPRLLIADEPTTALDVTVQAGILALLSDLQAQTGLAILLVSHDWNVISQMCDDIAVMYAGQIVEKAPHDVLLGGPTHPYTQGLLACRPSLLEPDAMRLPAIPGTVPSPEQWPHHCRFANRCAHRIERCTSQPIALRPFEASDTRCIRAEELVVRQREAGTHG